MTRSLSNFYHGNYVVRGEEVRRVINANDRIAQKMQEIEREQKQARREELKRLRQEAIDNGTIDEHPEFKEGLFAQELELEPEAAQEPEIDYVAQAKEEAAQILETAQSQAAQIHEQAVAEAAQLRESAKQEGYREGHDTAAQEADERQRAQDEAYAAKEQALQNRYDEALSGLEPQLVDTMLTVFDEVFGMQFRGKREMLLQLVKHAMRGIRETKYYKIHVCESEVKYLREHKEELQEKVGEDVMIEIVMDPGLTESQCIIDADSGVYDCSLDVELDNLTRDLRSLSLG